MTYLLAFLASFVSIAFRSFQQLNVFHNTYWAVLPTALLMSAADVFVITLVASHSWGLIVLPIGLGGGLGCFASMALHRRLK